MESGEDFTDVLYVFEDVDADGGIVNPNTVQVFSLAADELGFVAAKGPIFVDAVR
jgi:hypothetical protein